jgi:hypothetical protein
MLVQKIAHKNLHRNSQIFVNDDSQRPPSVLRHYTEDYLKNVGTACSVLTQWHKAVHPKSIHP